MRLTLKQLTIAASTAALGLLLTIGCGGEQSPLAQDPDPDTIASVEAGQSILAFSSPGLRPAAKGLRGNAGHVATSAIGGRGGQLQITDDGGLRFDKLVVTLDVPQRALRTSQNITMEVSGGKLSELVILFSPAGLVFSKDASLTAILEKNLYLPEELEGLTVQHFDGDGNLVESIVPDVTVGRQGTVTVTIPVPGFSRYGLR